MTSRPQLRKLLVAVIGVAALATAGCPNWGGFGYQRPSASPLGTLSDPVWQNQEANAERSDFVVHEHEFIVDAEFLNTAGEDHLKQIAARLTAGQDAQVLVERSWNSARPDTEYKFRVHPNPELDMRRRDVVVRCLIAMKIPDADARTVVSPDLAPQYRSTELSATDLGDNIGQAWNGGGWGGGGGGGWGGGGGGWGGGDGGWGFAGGNPSSNTAGSANSDNGGSGYRR